MPPPVLSICRSVGLDQPSPTHPPQPTPPLKMKFGQILELGIWVGWNHHPYCTPPPLRPTPEFENLDRSWHLRFELVQTTTTTTTTTPTPRKWKFGQILALGIWAGLDHHHHHHPQKWNFGQISALGISSGLDHPLPPNNGGGAGVCRLIAVSPKDTVSFSCFPLHTVQIVIIVKTKTIFG